VNRTTLLVIGIGSLALIVIGFLFARGPEPHIVIPGEVIAEVGPLNITNTLIAAWTAIVILVVAAFLATRTMALIPSGFQNFIESILDFLLGQMEEIAGKENARRFFMVVTTFFLFILVSNWIALLPFFKTFGKVVDYGVEIFHYTQEYEEKGKTFPKKEFLAWEMEEAGAVGLVNPGAFTFKFKIAEGTSPQTVFDHYVVALAIQFTDFDPGYEIKSVEERSRPPAADVRAAWEALRAQPTVAPQLLTEDPHHGDGGHHAFTSETLGVKIYGVDFPDKKLGQIYAFYRAAFSDLNNTLGLAICAFVIIEIWGFSVLGAGYLKKFFNFSNPIMTFVGFLELVSEFIRIISFSFRLFGNIFAGGVLLLIFTFLIPFIAPLTIFGLELFVGLIQAIVFSLLTLVFGVGAVAAHHDEEHEEHHGDGHAAAHHEGTAPAH
jgi:F0F1-type ATP synthase membrane subunit a